MLGAAVARFITLGIDDGLRGDEEDLPVKPSVTATMRGVYPYVSWRFTASTTAGFMSTLCDVDADPFAGSALLCLLPCSTLGFIGDAIGEWRTPPCDAILFRMPRTAVISLDATAECGTLSRDCKLRRRDPLFWESDDDKSARWAVLPFIITDALCLNLWLPCFRKTLFS